MFLITGCGRSGTKYIATVLQQCGLDVGHEKPGTDGCVSSIWAVRDDYYPSYHDQARPTFKRILHQVRHPLDAIGSLMTASQESWAWNARHIKLDPGWSPLLKATFYWYHWNRMVETRHQPEFRYRIEELPEVWPEVCRWVGLEVIPEIPPVPTDLNHREHPVCRWADLHRLAPEWFRIIYGLAKEYGYESMG